MNDVALTVSISGLTTDADYQGLLSRISEVYTNGQLRAHQAVNSQLTATCWQIGRGKDELLVEYATYKMDSQLFVQKYQLYLPNREELRRGLELHLTNCRTARPNIGKRCGGGQMMSAYKLNLHGLGYGN